MQFVVDESTGSAVVDYLRSLGHDVLAVAEAMPQADDSDILDQAAIEERILITNDKDFGELVFRRAGRITGSYCYDFTMKAHQIVFAWWRSYLKGMLIG
jgi:predicted nuclease of predicted toxin-antitoxin system